MARERGTFNFSASLEIKKEGALDARQIVNTKAELIQASTWLDDDNKIWLYNGLLVCVVADTDINNGVYFLKDKDNYTTESNWIKVAAISGSTPAELEQSIASALAEAKDYTDTKVGSADFSDSNYHYIYNTDNVTDALIALDNQVKKNFNDISGAEGNISDLKQNTVWGIKMGSNDNLEAKGDENIVTLSVVTEDNDGILSKEDYSELLKGTIENLDVINNTSNRLTIEAKYLSILNPSNTWKETMFTLDSATQSLAGLLSAADKTKVDKLVIDSEGTKFLSDDGTYKDVSALSAQEIYTIVPSETANTANASVYTLLKNNPNIVVVYKDNDLFFPVSWSYTATNTFMGSAMTYKYTSSTVETENYDWVSYDINIHSDGVCYCTQRSLQKTFGALGIFSFIYPSNNVEATGWNASLYSVVNPTAGYAAVIEIEEIDTVYNKHIGKLTKTPDNITIVCTEGNTQTTYVCTPDGNITKQEADITIDWNNIESKPSTFTPSTHTHTVGQITDLQNKLNDYVLIDGDAFKPNNMCWGGTTTDGTTTCLAFINPEDIALFGHTSLPLRLRSSSNPTVLVGTSTYTLLHTGNIGSITFTGAATGTFTGLNDLTINIPQGGGTADSVAWENVTGKPTFATVATSGSYNDLTDKPSIPSSYTLPIASTDTLGGIKVGGGLTINSSGVLSATGGGVADSVDIENVAGLNSSWLSLLQSAPSRYVTADPTWAQVTGKPDTFTPSAHTHTIAQITDLQDKLDDYYPKTGIGYLSFDTDGRPVMANNQGYSFKRADGSLLEALFVSPANELIIGGTSSNYVTDIKLNGTNLVNKSGATYLNTDNIGSIKFTGAVSATFNGTNDITVNIPTAGGGVADSVDWSNVTNKPSWIGSTKPTYSFSEISGTIAISDLPTGTTGSTVALGNHTHNNYATTSYVNTQINNLTYADVGAAASGHGHTFSDITFNNTGTYSQYLAGDGKFYTIGWNEIGSKPSTFSPSSHTHSVSDITSGTLSISRIPTGTTSSTVALGNHTHSQYLTSSSLSGYATESYVDNAVANVSIDTSNFVTLNGTQTITGTKTFTQYTVFSNGAGTSSDKRLKRSIKPIENPFEILEGLTGYRYTLISNNAKSVGLIAQDVEKVLPEAVRTDDEGYKSVDTYPIVAVLVETIKELKKEIEELKSKL